MKNNDLQWHRTLPEKPVAPGEVHIWQIPLNIDLSKTKTLVACLSGDEAVRASRFHFEKDRNLFIAARASLRRILGRYLNQEPLNIAFEYNGNGKPKLAAGSGELQFNLSHSGDVALCAVTWHRNIGVDVERIRRDIAIEQIAHQFFSQDEVTLLKAADQSHRYELFFRYWTRKEAIIKAKGDGISFPMNKVDVAWINGRNFSPVLLPAVAKENKLWSVQDLFICHGYAAAVAVEGTGSDLTCLYYSL
jgi:4'-phosphopantetheinyl transferase